jgi:hypothetical protein
VIWSVGLRQCTAAAGYPALIEGVENLLAFAAHRYEAGFAQDAQVVRDGGLGDVQGFHDLVDAEPLAAAQAHDLLAGVVSERLGKIYRVYGASYHIDNLLYVVIIQRINRQSRGSE